MSKSCSRRAKFAHWSNLLAVLLAACGSADKTLVVDANAGAVSGFAPRIAFYALAVLVVGGAFLTITRRNSVSAVMSLVATFFGLAGLYTLLSAHFLAAVQVLVYAGAIMTLFVFVVMVLNREEVDPWARRGLVTKALGIGVAVGGMAWIATLLRGWNGTQHLEAPPPSWGGVAGVGDVLFQEYLFPFEAVSLLLLIAVIAAVVVARIPRSAAMAARDAETAATEDADAATRAAAPAHSSTPLSGGH